MEARYWHEENGRVRCELCPVRCLVDEGRGGRCLGRRNRGGKMVAVNYGEVVSVAIDPIEKKPLYHFHPGADILSVCSYGCNLRCPFCQNSEISQSVAPTRFIPPDELLLIVKQHGLRMVSYTYTEPLVWFEYVLDTSRLMRSVGIKNVLVTNGVVNPEPLEELLPMVDAMNIDLKSIRPAFYSSYVRGDLATVLGTIRAARNVCHVELTTLLIPGRNDSDAELEELTDFVAGLGRSTVLHLSRYFPRHHATEPATPVERLLVAAEIAAGKLDYVYLGNVEHGSRFRDTRCPVCGCVLVTRERFHGSVVGVENGCCIRCGRRADIVL
uniref:AmmeMemoRadiSam system radical SAM enzyme n=1 Tax=candidate division WOR-3 bacterium TaxID=2052148 RepID=A0A7C4C9V6_UNCW3